MVRWRKSQVGRGQIEDRRGRGGGMRFPSGGGMRFPSGGGRRGGGAVGGGLGLLILVLAVIFGPGLLGGGGGGPSFESFPEQAPPQGGGSLTGAPDPQANLVDYIQFLDGSIEGFWAEEFQRAGREYQDAPPLVIFDGFTETGCGSASSEIGPFYCPLDSRVYLDLGFFRELQTRFGAPGDFAQAYVIAHEYGHHVQNVLGINEQVRNAQQSDPDQANEYSIRLELQADCLAGVWANGEQDILDPGDIEEGLTAAAAVGDDRIQSQATGQINPETWTHGSSEQRVEWFQRGYESGDINTCDTFS